jgi:hypothetical protein
MSEKMAEVEVTLPLWLDEMATDAGLDYSDILQKALMDYLGISTSTR